jgi:hypothetical protein
MVAERYLEAISPSAAATAARDTSTG